MNTGNQKKLFYTLLLVWLIVNILQAVFTEILSDEAYYGLYGKYLAWGYFDHPPMVAILIKISSLFFKGNLGIRFMTVILQTVALLFTWRIIDEKKPDSDKIYSFFIIAASICMFCAYGFVTTPDVPLLFFTSFFLYSYKKFTFDQKWLSVIFLSLSMAGLVYSKYQAVLVIGFVVLSNIKVLKSYKFWISGLCALILLTPHIWWQIANDYPSFKYHLVERSEGFKWLYLIEYLPNQMAVFNPLILGAAVYIIVKTKVTDLFTRALYFSIIGFIVFFGLTAFRGHVEPHWTIACSIPMIILIYNNSTVNPKMFRFIRKALVPTLVIIFVLRILLVTNLPLVKYFGFSGKKEKYEHIESVAKDLPVVFMGSFQRPALYTFFTGKEAMAINSLNSRKTQFDIWQFEKKYNNKPVFVCGFGEGDSKTYEKGSLKFFGYQTDSLQTINRIGIKIKPSLKLVHAGDSVNLLVTFSNPCDFDIDFKHNRKFPVGVYTGFLKGEALNLFPVDLKEPVRIIHGGETLTRSVTIVVPGLPAGKYKFGICIQNIFGPAINDSFSDIKILNQ